MLRKFRLPSPSLSVALIALFVALSGTAVGATVVPLAKRALVADNAKKLGGKTPAALLAQANASAKTLATQAAQAAAAQPGPASSAAGLVVIKSTAVPGLPSGSVATRQIPCDPGQVAIGGGLSSDTRLVGVFDSFQLNPSTWQVGAGNLGGGPANVTMYAVCLK